MAKIAATSTSIRNNGYMFLSGDFIVVLYSFLRPFICLENVSCALEDLIGFNFLLLDSNWLAFAGGCTVLGK